MSRAERRIGQVRRRKGAQSSGEVSTGITGTPLETTHPNQLSLSDRFFDIATSPHGNIAIGLVGLLGGGKLMGEVMDAEDSRMELINARLLELGIAATPSSTEVVQAVEAIATSRSHDATPQPGDIGVITDSFVAQLVSNDSISPLRFGAEMTGVMGGAGVALVGLGFIAVGLIRKLPDLNSR